MKRVPIIVIMLLMACLSASAQYADAHKLKKVADLSFVTPSGGVGLAFRF